MAVTTVNVTGPVEAPDADAMEGASIRFTLDKVDFDLADDVTIFPETVSQVLDAQGDFTQALWPNSRGQAASRYRVVLIAGSSETPLGRISVPEAGAPHKLSDLLAAGTPAPGAVYMGLITQDQYDAAMAAHQASYSFITKTADYTLADGDEYKEVLMDSASPLTLTIPADSTHEFDVGTWFVVTRAGTGTVTLAAEGGVTLNNAYGLTIPDQWASFFVRKMDDKSGNGNHATQATAAARPIYGRVPATGRRNLLTETETLVIGTWTASEATTAPEGDGVVSITPSANNAQHYAVLNGFTTWADNANHTISAEFKVTDPDVFKFVRFYSRTKDTKFPSIYVDLTTGAKTETGGPHLVRHRPGRRVVSADRNSQCWHWRHAVTVRDCSGYRQHIWQPGLRGRRLRRPARAQAAGGSGCNRNRLPACRFNL